MLVIVLVVAVLSSLGAAAVAKVGHVALRRLGLELWPVLYWFGIAEPPLDELEAKRRSAPVSRTRGTARPARAGRTA